MKIQQSEDGKTNFQMKVHFENVGGWEEEVNEPGGARTVETTIKPQHFFWPINSTTKRAKSVEKHEKLGLGPGNQQVSR